MITWSEFINTFNVQTLKNVVDELNKDKRKRNTISHRRRYLRVKKDDEGNKFVYKLEPLEIVNDDCVVVRYTKKAKNGEYQEYNLMGYFQRFEIGWVFIVVDSSHVWKKIRDVIPHDESIQKKSDLKNVTTIGSNLVFADLSKLEIDKRYYMINDGKIVDHSFICKVNCVKIDDVYVGSQKGLRYFIVLDSFYSSSDYLTNIAVKNKKFFDNLKDISNEDLIMIFNKNSPILENREELSKQYGEKVVNKLLKL